MQVEADGMRQVGRGNALPVTVREVLETTGDGARVGRVEDLPRVLGRFVVPVRVVEVEKEEERPVADAVEHVHGPVGDVGGLPVLVEVEMVEAVVEAVDGRHVEVAGHGMRRKARLMEQRRQSRHAAVEAVAHVDAAMSAGVDRGEHG